MKYTSSIFLKTETDPDAIGPSIADSYNLSPDDCFANFWHRTLPHHLVAASMPKSNRPKYKFALTILSRSLWNKRYLHSVSVESPTYSFPLWKLSPEHLIQVRERLYSEIAYESAKLCMNTFFEIASQAHRDGLVTAVALAKYYAITADTPENRNEKSEELLRIIRMSLAQCNIQKHDAMASRDAAAILLTFLTAITPAEASRLTLQHLQKQRGEDNTEYYTFNIPTSVKHKRVVPLGKKASRFLGQWLKQIYGTSVFCNSTQFPDCQNAHPKLLSTILARRLSLVVETIPTLADFQQNHDLKVLQSFDDGLINLTGRKLLLGKVKPEFSQELSRDALKSLTTFYHTFEETLGWWNFSSEKA